MPGNGYFTYGGINTGKTTNNFFALSNDLSTEGFSGFYTTGYCYKQVKKYQLVYYDFKQQGWGPARGINRVLEPNIDSYTMPAKGIALDTVFGSYSVRILLYGGLYNSIWNFDMSKYKFVWLSQLTPGNMTLSPLVRIGDFKQPVGIITSPKQIFFNFYQLYFIHFNT